MLQIISVEAGAFGVPTFQLVHRLCSPVNQKDAKSKTVKNSKYDFLFKKAKKPTVSGVPDCFW